MSRHSASKKEKKNRLLLNTFLVFVVVTGICAGVILTVILMPSSEQTLKAPGTPTSKPDPVSTYRPKNTFLATLSPSPTPEITPEPTERIDNNRPIFTMIDASSIRKLYSTETDAISYPPENAFDNNKNTVWTPEPYEVNPWIRMSSSSEQTVNGLEIINGYAKNRSLYKANRRAKDITVECNNTIYSYTLPDSGAGKSQFLNFPEPVETTSIRITVLSTYEGTDYNDLCITEIIPF